MQRMGTGRRGWGLGPHPDPSRKDRAEQTTGLPAAGDEEGQGSTDPCPWILHWVRGGGAGPTSALFGFPRVPQNARLCPYPCPWLPSQLSINPGLCSPDPPAKPLLGQRSGSSGESPGEREKSRLPAGAPGAAAVPEAASVHRPSFRAEPWERGGFRGRKQPGLGHPALPQPTLVSPSPARSEPSPGS